MLAGVSRGEGIDNQITGDILPEANGLKMATIYRSHIDPEYRGQGVGSKLYKAFTRLAVEHGANQLGAVSPSAAAMRTRLRLFDPTRIKFYYMTDEDVEEVVTTEVEISADESQKRIAARERFDQHMRTLQEKYGDQISERITEAEKAQSGLFAKEIKPFSVVVDLRGLDVSDWEPEVEVSGGGRSS
jgi:hypothetical protein